MRCLCLAILATLPVWPAAANSPTQPYAGLTDRPIKALSAKELDDLRAGRGMGLALAAELNGFPGPLHVLEHADALGLDTAQREIAAALTTRMRRAAISRGEALIAAETALDALFRDGVPTEAAVAAATATIGATQGALRLVHLATHIEMRDALTPHQRARYAALRGYSGSHPARH